MRLLLPFMVLTGATLVPTAAVAQDEPLGLPIQVSYSYNLDNSPSPDGGEMVFIKYIEGRQQLFIMDTEGRNERRLTADDAHHVDPSWSPDGSQIAFVRTGDDGGRAVQVVRPDGSGMRVIPTPGQSVNHPSWSPDSERIVYSTDDEDDAPPEKRAGIHSVSLETGEIVELVPGGANTYASLSPDGRRLLFRSLVDGTGDVFVAEADGSNALNLTRHSATDGWPAWSPDGREIAFASNRNSVYQVFVMDADGSNVRLLANTDGRSTVPRWSPDGRRIYFTNCRNVSLRRSCEIFAVDVDSHAFR